MTRIQVAVLGKLTYTAHGGHDLHTTPGRIAPAIPGHPIQEGISRFRKHHQYQLLPSAMAGGCKWHQLHALVGRQRRMLAQI
ncbi:MAG TPA: hypothetical protein VE666_13840 [Mycobacterium sp.]|nr:hypothetical protein [Mycobacterium sp.]